MARDTGVCIRYQNVYLKQAFFARTTTCRNSCLRGSRPKYAEPLKRPLVLFDLEEYNCMMKSSIDDTMNKPLKKCMRKCVAHIKKESQSSSFELTTAEFT